MSINETMEKIKPFYTLIIFLFISIIFFALGRLSVIQENNKPIKIQYGNEASVISSLNSRDLSESSTTKVETPQISQTGAVIGSKSGKKYYFPWCGTVKRIKPENQVHFSSIEEAKKAGFTPGGNCKGLQ